MEMRPDDMPRNSMRDEEPALVDKDKAAIKELANALKEAAGNEKDLYIFNKYNNLADKYLGKK